jgi:hypothetical protein
MKGNHQGGSLNAIIVAVGPSAKVSDYWKSYAVNMRCTAFLRELPIVIKVK